MAKSLRSKPKLRAKSIKRQGEFAKFVDDRNARLAEKNRLNLQRQKEEQDAQMAVAEETPVQDAPMAEASEEAPKKVSSSKKKKLKEKRKKNRSLKF